ncbi:beta-lactamase-like protein [Glomus cerebriforme]|uniref:Beta-lactamase-like protein n=1 Tax=Glomus cerebriforme TaxID=658196 RepID=A0A397TKV9_9GLOM|nr:beta-lactamase-like protein [Glomus cerebriforme]
MMKELVHFFGDSALQSRTHSQPGSTNIFTGVTADWNVARSLYSIADIQSCTDKVRPVRFGEHLNLYELEVTAYSSGYCLGSANWMIDCGGEKVTIVSSSSTVQNIHPLPFDETVFNNADVIILSDLRDEDGVRFENTLMEIGNCVANTLKNKGNVLFPCTMNGIIFDIIDFLNQHIRAMGLHGIPFYAISPIAEESLKYSNICGEWMCTERQQKMYLPDNPMPHQDMIEQSSLYYATRADSSLQEKYQEPCVVFAGHPSLRSGAAINFIRKWGNNSNNSIIFTESEYNHEEAMSAFEGLQIKPTYLPIDIRLTVNEIANMLREKKPQHVLFPQKIIGNVRPNLPNSLITLYECLDIVNISINSQFVRTVMTENLASNIELVNIGKDSLIASLNGTLNIHNTKTALTSAKNPLNQQKYVCGEFNVAKLINELTEQIYGCRIDEFEEDKKNSSCKISLMSPKATIYLNNENFKIITTDNQTRIKLTKILIDQLVVI